MNKKTKYGVYGAAIGVVAAGILNIIDQHSENSKAEPFDWSQLFRWVLGGAAIGGGSGLLLGTICDFNNSTVTPINTDAILQSFLHEIRLQKTDTEYKLLKSKSDWLISLLNTEFTYDLKMDPFLFGSTERNTALKEYFDIDICLCFKTGTFLSISQMMDYVLSVLKRLNGQNGIKLVRLQKKSVGVIFELNGTERKIDILPYQASSSRKNDHAGFMFVNKGIFERPSRSKTNVVLLNNQKITETQKKILVILKEWKVKNRIKISSHLLQNLIFEAYRYNKHHIPRSLTKKIVMVMYFIKENLDSMRLHSIENTNNILTNISEFQKTKIVAAVKNVINEYEYQPNSIVQLAKHG